MSTQRKHWILKQNLVATHPGSYLFEVEAQTLYQEESPTDKPSVL